MMRLNLVPFFYFFAVMALQAQQWEKIVPTPTASVFETPNFWSKMSAVDTNTVWIADYSGQIATRTNDGGKTWKTTAVQGWESIEPDFSLSNIYAADANTAFVIAYRPPAETVTFRTKDGGDSWENAFKKGEYTTPGSFLNGIHFFNPRNGLAWGDPVRDTFEFYRTTDGGDTWKRVVTPLPVANEAMYFNQFDAYGDTIWIGSTRARVFKSPDQGQTWTVSSLPASGYVSSIAMTNGHEGAVLLGGGSKYYTDNDGKNWIFKPNPSRYINSSAKIFGVPGRSGIFINSNDYGGYANLSFDTCKTWPISIIPTDVSSFFALRFFNSKQGWALAGDSVLLKWKNPRVIFDLVGPDYTAITVNQASDKLKSGAKVALWSGSSDANYQLSHSLFKDGKTVATSSNTLKLLPGKVGSSFLSPKFSGKGEYAYKTTLQENNALIQEGEVFLTVGDSMVSKSADLPFYYENENRGNFFELNVEDILSSIKANFLAFAPSTVQFKVFGYDPIRKIYNRVLHTSIPIPVLPKDTTFILGVDTFLASIPFDLTYQLPKSLSLPSGNYAICIQLGDQNVVFGMSTHKINAHAFIAGSRADSISNYGFSPMLSANFRSKQTTVPTKDPDLSAGIRVFPNPMEDRFSIELPQDFPTRMAGSNVLKIRLFNTSGQEVHSEQLNIGMTNISVPQLPTGVYTWQISGGGRQMVLGQVVKVK